MHVVEKLTQLIGLKSPPKLSSTSSNSPNMLSNVSLSLFNNNSCTGTTVDGSEMLLDLELGQDSPTTPGTECRESPHLHLQLPVAMDSPAGSNNSSIVSSNPDNLKSSYSGTGTESTDLASVKLPPPHLRES